MPRLDQLEKKYPWRRTPPKGFFFVPTLKPREVYLEGLRYGHEVLGNRAVIQGAIGIYRKRLGVMFTVRSV